MSLLHPTEEDEEFAAEHAQAGWNKAVRRCVRLRKLLQRARSTVADETLASEIDAALQQTFYDESEEPPPGEWNRES